MTIKITDLLVEIITKKANVLLEGKYKKHVALKEEESDEEEREVLHRDPESGQLGKKRIKVARDKSMHSTSKQAKAASAAGGKTVPTKKSPKKEKPIAAGSEEHAKKMSAAKAEFDKWDAQRKLKKTTSDTPSSSSAEDEGHRRALAAAKRKEAKKAAKSQVSEETDAEHAKELGRDIKRYEKGGKAAHKAALAAAKKREAREKGEK